MKRARETNNWQLECAEMKQRGEFLFRTKLWSDVVFQFGRKKFIRAHKLLLAMASPVFGSMFYDHVFVNPVRITDVPAEVFNVLLEYIYSDNMYIPSPDYACDLYYAGQQYDMPYVTQQCVQYLSRHINQDNICHIYEVASVSCEEALQKACMELFRRQTKEVLSSDSFTHAAQRTVVKLFSLDNLDIDSELDLYVAAVKYADAEDVKDDSMLEYTEEMSMMSDGPSPSKRARLRFSDDFNSSRCNGEQSGNNLSKDGNESIRDDETKSRYRDILQQIRFLTLTPAEFAECKLLLSLLTAEQILALSLNIASKDTPVKMPEGFSYSMVPRNRATEVDRQRISATFHSKIHNVMTLKKHESIPFYVRNTAWTFLMINDLRSSHDNDSFGIAVTCYLDNASANWLNTVRVKVKFYATDKNYLKVALDRQMNACKQSRFHGIWTTRLSRFQILHPTQPYVDGNTLTYKVYVTTEETSDEASTPNVPKDIRAGQDSNNNDAISQTRSEAPGVTNQSLNTTLKSMSVNGPSASQSNSSAPKTLPLTPAVPDLSKPESCGLRSPAPINMSSRNAKPVSHGMSDLSQLPQAIRLPPPVPFTPNQSQVKDNLMKYAQILQATTFSAPTSSGIPELRSNLTQWSQPSDYVNKLKLLLDSKRWSAVQQQFIYDRLKTAQVMRVRGEITRNMQQHITYNTIRKAQLMQAGALALPVYGDPGVRSITPFSRRVIAPMAAAPGPLKTTFGLRPRHIRHTGPLPTSFGLRLRHTAASLTAVSHGKNLANLKSGEEIITSSPKVLNMTDRPAVFNSGTPQTFVARPGITHVSSVINKHYSARPALTSNVQMATDRVTAPSSGVTSVVTVTSNKISEIPLPSISQVKEVTTQPKDINSAISSSDDSDNVSSTVRETPKNVIATAKTQDSKRSMPMLNLSKSTSDGSESDASDLDKMPSIGKVTPKTAIATVKIQDSKESLSTLKYLSESSSDRSDADTSNLDNVPSTVRETPKTVIATAKTQDSKQSVSKLNLSESSSDGSESDASNLDKVPSIGQVAPKTAIATTSKELSTLNLSESSSDSDASDLDNLPSIGQETLKTAIATKSKQCAKQSTSTVTISAVSQPSVSSSSNSDNAGSIIQDAFKKSILSDSHYSGPDNVSSTVVEASKKSMLSNSNDSGHDKVSSTVEEVSQQFVLSDSDNMPSTVEEPSKTGIYALARKEPPQIFSGNLPPSISHLKEEVTHLSKELKAALSFNSGSDDSSTVQESPKTVTATACTPGANQSVLSVTVPAESQPTVSSSDLMSSVTTEQSQVVPGLTATCTQEKSSITTELLPIVQNYQKDKPSPSVLDVKTSLDVGASLKRQDVTITSETPNDANITSKDGKEASDNSTLDHQPSSNILKGKYFSTDSEMPHTASTPNKTIVTPTKMSEFAKEESVPSDTFHDKTDSLTSGEVVPFSPAKDDVKGDVAVDLETYYSSPNLLIRDIHSGATKNTLPFSLSNVTLDVKTASFSLDILSSSEDSSDSEFTSSPPSKKVKRDMFESANTNSTSALSFSLSNISPNGATASCSIDILDSNEDSVNSPPPSKKIKRELIEYYKDDSVSEDEDAYSFPKDIGIDAVKRESDIAESEYTATSPKYTPCTTVYSPSSPGYASTSSAYSPTSLRHAPTSSVHSPSSPGNASTSSAYSSKSLRHAPMSPRSPTTSLYSPVHTPTTSVYSPLSPGYAPTSSVYSPVSPVLAPWSPSFASTSHVHTPTSLVCVQRSPLLPKSSINSPKSFLSTFTTSTPVSHALPQKH